MQKNYIKLIMLFTTLIIGQQIIAQQMLTGRIADSNGEAVPGANIFIKGTDRGTITDINGVYSIEVYMGDVLTISFVGMRTREIEITPKTFKQLSFNGDVLKNRNPRAIVKVIPKYYNDPVVTTDPKTDSVQNTEGVAYLGHSTNRLSRYSGRKTDYGIALLKEIKFDEHLNSFVFNFERPYKQKVGHFELNSSVTFDAHTQLSDIQDVYSSGTVQNGQFVYTSPLEQNLLSWGPQINTLEYDGLNSEYYPQGNIVGVGQGTSLPLTTYDRTDFFKTGIKLNNSLEYRISNNDKYIYAKYINTSNTGIFPGADLTGHALSAGMKSNFFDARAFYTISNGRHNMEEANYARILHTLYITPPEFDNLNGYSIRQAINEQNAFLTPSGGQRSFGANLIENPLWLAANDPSHIETQQYGANLAFHHSFLDNWKYNVALGIRNEENSNTAGFVSFFAPQNGVISNKKDANLNVNGEGGLSKEFYFDYFSLSNYIRYMYNYTQYDYQSERYALLYSLSGGIYRGEAIAGFEQQNTRFVNEIVVGQTGESSSRNWPLNYKVSLNIYQSNTCDNVYWLPNAKLILDISSFDNWVRYNLPGKVYVQYARTLNEFDFQNRPNHFNTINFNAAEFRNYSEQKNVFIENGIRPTISNSFFAGIDLQNVIYHQLSLSFDYYYKHVKDAIFPMQNNVFILVNNLADLTNKGFEATVRYSGRFYNVALLFSKQTTLVDKLNSGTDIVPIAGFNDVYKSLIEGEEVGVIVGSRYLRNEAGELIIGADGYPLVDPNPGIIGSPNPDWTVNLNNSFKWRRFNLDILLEYKHGGQVWNGTKNILNYYGASLQSADSRNITGHIYPGVNQNGEPNTIPVDFANPANDINEFRYLRYGYTGVAEDAIEDASWFRIKKIALRYDFGQIQNPVIPLASLKLSFWIENFWTVTPYSGVDSQSSLFGYDAAQELDLFNAPGVRRFGINLNITF